MMTAFLNNSETSFAYLANKRMNGLKLVRRRLRPSVKDKSLILLTYQKAKNLSRIDGCLMSRLTAGNVLALLPKGFNKRKALIIMPSSLPLLDMKPYV